MVLPGLEVTGLGPVALPLTENAAKELITRCHQAPYGKGTETVVYKDRCVVESSTRNMDT